MPGKKVDPERKKASRERSNANLELSSRKGRGFTREQAQAGQRAQAQQRREHRAAKELMRDILSMSTATITADTGSLGQVAELLAEGGKITVYQATLLAQAARAVAGDTAAAAFCRDTAGDKPTDRQEVATTVSDGDKALLQQVAQRLGCAKSPYSADDKGGNLEK